jgi:hypothetical protein
MPRPVTILSLPAPLLERILTHAAHGRRGKLPFATWSTLPAVHPAFRAAFYAAVSRVALADAYAVSAAHYPTLASYTHAARRILAGPLLRCGRLRDLDLNACDALTDEDVAAFAARAPPLASFTVTVCRGQTDAAVLALARASPRLRAADVSGCDRHRHSAALLAAGGADPDAVREARWAAGQRHVPCHALTNSSLLALATFCRGLRSLTVSNAPHVTDTALRALAALPELDDVVLRRLPAITDAGVRALVSGPASLTSLSLFSNTALGDDALRAVATGRASRRSLAFFGMTFSYAVSDAGFAALVEAVPTLDELQADHCGQVTDAWTRPVRGGGGLTRVSVRNVGIVLTARGVCDLANDGRGGSRLTALNLGFVASVDAELLRALRDAAPALEVLVLDACGGVDDEAAEVIGGFEKLRTLDLSWCSKVTAAGVSSLCGGVAGPRLTRLSIGPLPRGSDEVGGADDLPDVEDVAAAGQGHGIALADEEEEAAAAPVLAALVTQEAAQFANALDLAVHEQEDEELTSAAEHAQTVGARSVDPALCEIGRRCAALRELVLCGPVDSHTVNWLRDHTQARIDYLDLSSGISSSIYGAEAETEGEVDL